MQPPTLPIRPRRLAATSVTVTAAVGAALLGAPAQAATYGTPTIVLSTAYLSGAVGSTGDPKISVTVSQSGAKNSALTVTASASSDSTVAATGDVTITGTGSTRTVAVTAEHQGYTDLTLKVTGLGGAYATKTLHYAASATVQNAPGTRYLTGASDASAAVDVGGGYVVVGDDENNTLRLYDRNSSGAPVRTWDFSAELGVSREIDIEAAARVGDTIYWTGSMGNSKSGSLRPDRSTLFTTKVTGSGATTQLTLGGFYQGLRDDLIAWDEANDDRFGFAAGAAPGQVPKQIDGFNVEGMEFAPDSTGTAYIAFRAPLVPPQTDGKALLVPVTNLDTLVAGSPDTAVHATFGDPITMDLGGLSIRDIRKNALNQYVIVAGSWAADDNSDSYALYSWDGVAADAPTLLRSLPTTDPGAWESVVDIPDLTVPGAQVQLITDAGSADLYGDGTEAKDLAHDEWKKSRTTWFTVS